MRSLPYAPMKAVDRTMGPAYVHSLPNPVTNEHLEQNGIASSVVPRTLATLRYFGLIDRDGNWLPPLERLSSAGPEQYQDVLADIVQRAYEPVLTQVSVSEATD